MERKNVQGKVSYYDIERKILGLDMPRPPESASMTFNLEDIIKDLFMGKNITIVVNDEKGNTSIDNNEATFMSGDEVANMYGVE